MKFSTAIFALVLAANSMATELVTCHSIRAVQGGQSNMQVDAELNFSLNREAKTLSKVVGHIFVKNPYLEEEGINAENSYMGFFKQETATHNSKYRPNKYKGYTQFQNFDAAHTIGIESGMWGEFVLDLKNSSANSFDARYIFQAGDHMGGVVLFTCRSHVE